MDGEGEASQGAERVHGRPLEGRGRIAGLLRRRPVQAGIVGAGLLVAAVVLLVVSGPPGPNARSAEVPEFAAIDDVREKKAAFFEFLAPMIADRNAWVLEQRALLERVRADLVAGDEPARRAQRRVEVLAERYRVPLDDGIDVGAIDDLLLHCDVVPPSLALAQAASESAWGTSRFAREGNNYFGEWCFSEGCGMVPARRGAGKAHEVETFDAVEDAVASYFRNLNRVDAYEKLRAVRAAAREAGAPITGSVLAAGLERYSERGAVYIEEIRELISYNRLGRYDRTQLATAPALPSPSG